jgi:apolipoprotein N-acyltransferase
MKYRAAGMLIAATAASGLLVAGLFPPFRCSVMVWVALVPWLAALWSLDGKRAAWKGFGLGWLAGSLSSMIQFHWLAVVSPLGAVILPLYLGLFWGLFGAFAASIGNPWRHPPTPVPGRWAETRRSLCSAFCLAALWAGLEWLRGWLFTGFGWNNLGVAFHESPVMAQTADLLGVAGLSMILVFFQAVLLQAGKRLLNKDSSNRSRPPLLDIAVTIAIIALLAGYGLARITTEKRKESASLKTLLVQINIPQDAARVLWSALDVHLAYEDETLNALHDLTENHPAQWPDWVMWPESALTGKFLRASDGTWGTWRENEETLAQVRTAGRFQLIFGTNELEAERTADDQLVMKDPGRAWNSLAVMSPDNDLQTYQKHHLVIFGETIPFVDSLPILKKIYAQQAGVEYGGSFTSGVSVEPLPIPLSNGTVINAIPTVCFEDTVPRLTRKFVRSGPQVIVNVTNDGWFKESPAAAQHFANARFRAIELRRPMLRCANTGVSAAIDSTGTTTHPLTGNPQRLLNAEGSHFTRGALLTELDVPLHPSLTLYALVGDWGVISLALLGVLTAALRSRSKAAKEPLDLRLSHQTIPPR